IVTTIDSLYYSLKQSMYNFCIFTRAIAWEEILGPKAIDEYSYTLVALVKSMLHIIIIIIINTIIFLPLFFINPFLYCFDSYFPRISFSLVKVIQCRVGNAFPPA